MTITEKVAALIALSDENKQAVITITVHRTHAEESPDANTPQVWDFTELLQIDAALNATTEG